MFRLNLQLVNAVGAMFHIADDAVIIISFLGHCIAVVDIAVAVAVVVVVVAVAVVAQQ